MIGGRGRDFLDGRQGSDTYYLLEEDTGDFITDSGNDWERYKQWYYHQRGVKDIGLSEDYGGNWIIHFDGQVIATAQTIEEFCESVLESERFSWSVDDIYRRAEYVPPLPELPVIAANDYVAMESLYGTGAMLQDTLRFAQGVDAANLTVMASEENNCLMLKGPTGMLATVDLPRAPEGEGDNLSFGNGIEYYEFADGTRMTLRQMVDLMRADHDSKGNDADETYWFDIGNDRVESYGGYDDLRGGGGNDTLCAGDGDDYLEGGEGDDILDGGAGNDELADYDGNDVFVFGRGYGQDVVYSWDESLSSTDIVRFLPDVSPADIVVQRIDTNGSDDLVLSIRGTTDTLTISSFFDPTYGPQQQIDAVEFADGTRWDAIRLAALVDDTAPVVEHALADQTASDGAAFSFTIPADAFSDADADDSLSYTATLANGDVGGISLKVTATDLAGATASQTFDLSIANINDAPVVAQALAA